MEKYLFQTYHSRENVLTANFLFFLSNVRRISERAYESFIFELCGPDEEKDDNLLSPKFMNQDKRKGSRSIPDGSITQGASKIIIETKGNGAAFTKRQLSEHLKRFNDEDLMLFITLDKYQLQKEIEQAVQDDIKEMNQTMQHKIYHKHLRFKDIITIMKININADREFELADLVDDYEKYLIQEDLMDDIEGRMRLSLAGASLETNKATRLYFQPYSFKPVEYIGLYKNKAIRALGKVDYVAKSSVENGEMKFDVYYPENRELTEDETKDLLERIEKCVKATGWNSIKEYPHYFYSVDHFYETDYKKTSPGGVLGARYFNLKDRLEVESLGSMSTDKIAENLKKKTWE